MTESDRHRHAQNDQKCQTAGAFHAAEVFHVFDTALPLVPVAPTPIS